MEENIKIDNYSQEEINEDHVLDACRTGDFQKLIDCEMWPKEYSLKDVIVNWRSKSGVTILMNSAWHGRKRIVEYLVSHWADVNVEDVYKNTALIACCSKNWNHSTDIASILINEGANVNQVCKTAVGSSPLILATLLNNKSMVELLLKKGANPNHLDKYGENPYCNAIYNEDYYHTRNESLEDNEEIIEILSKKTDSSTKPTLSMVSKKAVEDPYNYFKKMRTREYLDKRFSNPTE